jgi:hypothetical protein
MTIINNAWCATAWHYNADKNAFDALQSWYHDLTDFSDTLLHYNDDPIDPTFVLQTFWKEKQLREMS